MNDISVIVMHQWHNFVNVKNDINVMNDINDMIGMKQFQKRGFDVMLCIDDGCECGMFYE